MKEGRGRRCKQLLGGLKEMRRSWKLKIRKANWIGHIWHRNCLPKHVIKGKIEGRME